MEAGKRGRTTVVLEHTDAPGKKILISGGGRCNFTNVGCRPENFLSENPHFAKSALARYTPEDFIDLVRKHRISFHEKKLGQLFCDGSARQIVEMLERECVEACVEIVLDCRVSVVRKDDVFIVETSLGVWEARSLVVATGGLSIPKIGATGWGHDIARQFGLKLVTPRPALVPFTWSEPDRANLADLAGVSAEVEVSYSPVSFREKMLFTHVGLSGPAILQISSYWRAGNAVAIDLLPGIEFVDEGTTPKALLRSHLAKRLADRWLEVCAPEDEDLTESIHNWVVRPAGTEGYAKAEVTAGGVSTAELSSKTMESRRVPGLYFIGEVVDVTGHLGGYNFQWAWASGYAAGQAV